MIEDLARDPGRCGLVGQHHIDAVGVELGDEVREFSLVAGELHRRLVLQHGAQDVVAHQLGERVHDADVQAQPADARRLFGGAEDLAAEGEDLLGMAVDQLAELR